MRDRAVHRPAPRLDAQRQSQQRIKTTKNNHVDQRIPWPHHSRLERHCTPSKWVAMADVPHCIRLRRAPSQWPARLEAAHRAPRLLLLNKSGTSSPYVMARLSASSQNCTEQNETVQGTTCTPTLASTARPQLVRARLLDANASLRALYALYRGVYLLKPITLHAHAWNRRYETKSIELLYDGNNTSMDANPTRGGGGRGQG